MLAPTCAPRYTPANRWPTQSIPPPPSTSARGGNPSSTSLCSSHPRPHARCQLLVVVVCLLLFPSLLCPPSLTSPPGRAPRFLLESLQYHHPRSSFADVRGRPGCHGLLATAVETLSGLCPWTACPPPPHPEWPLVMHDWTAARRLPSSPPPLHSPLPSPWPASASATTGATTSARAFQRGQSSGAQVGAKGAP